MPRPRMERIVAGIPEIAYFKPAGVRMIDLEEVVLTVDEFEALRLKDFEEIEQEEAAKKMAISQPTFHRLLLSSRKKVADALTNGKAIRIEGGHYRFAAGRGRGMGRRFRGGRV